MEEKIRTFSTLGRFSENIADLMNVLSYKVSGGFNCSGLGGHPGLIHKVLKLESQNLIFLVLEIV